MFSSKFLLHISLSLFISFLCNIVCASIIILYGSQSFVLTEEDNFTRLVFLPFILMILDVSFTLITAVVYLISKKLQTKNKIFQLISLLLFMITIISPFIILFASSNSHEFYHKKFQNAIKSFDEGPSINSSEWINQIQFRFKCCGYNGPRNYKEFFKPPSCCNDSTISKMDNNNNSDKCRYPPYEKEGVFRESPNYYKQGCALKINEIITKFNYYLFYLAIADFVLLMCYLLYAFITIDKKQKQKQEKIFDFYNKLLQYTEYSLEEIETLLKSNNHPIVVANVDENKLLLCQEKQQIMQSSSSLGGEEEDASRYTLSSRVTQQSDICLEKFERFQKNEILKEKVEILNKKICDFRKIAEKMT